MHARSAEGRVNSFGGDSKSVPAPAHRALLLCAGPEGNTDNLHSFLAKAGFSVDAFDVLDGSQCDITDDAVWDPIHAKLNVGLYMAVFASPPCGSFSMLRDLPGGPPMLSSVQGAGRYGLRDVSVLQK